MRDCCTDPCILLVVICNWMEKKTIYYVDVNRFLANGVTVAMFLANGAFLGKVLLFIIYFFLRLTGLDYPYSAQYEIYFENTYLVHLLIFPNHFLYFYCFKI